MSKNLKRFIAIVLVLATVLPVLSACGKVEETPETTTVPLATEPEEEAKVLKVLTLGHSLAVNTGHMLALIAATEGFENLVVGTLYYSGCPLSKHVEFAASDAKY